ncbi:hypothetical protein KTE60_08765 [Burkholderia multivorans]|uniref:hypothetical protein n=1 Tax=Burkholderia multivorans TaxID=87883 RepID=UPI0012D9CEC0|nr:hypothetical protein [Burkholderia multivorans]MBU9629376.1 hypothetical protein [Burkholderia multivorans]
MNDEQQSRVDALTIPRELLLDLIDDVQSFADQIPCREREKAFRADLLARARAIAASPIEQPVAAPADWRATFEKWCCATRRYRIAASAARGATTASTSWRSAKVRGRYGKQPARQQRRPRK